MISFYVLIIIRYYGKNKIKVKIKAGSQLKKLKKLIAKEVLNIHGRFEIVDCFKIAV